MKRLTQTLKPATRRAKISVIALLGLLLLTVAMAVAVHALLFRDAGIVALRTSQDGLYNVVAQEASSIRVALGNADVAKLKDTIMTPDNGRLLLGEGVISGSNTIYWDAEATSQGDATKFISHEVRSSKACVQYSANVSKKTVTVLPVRCGSSALSAHGLDAHSVEILLDQKKIEQVRANNRDIPQCYPSYRRGFDSYSCPRY